MYEDGHDGYIYCVFYGVNRTYKDYDYDVTYFTIQYNGDEEHNYVKSEVHQLVTGTSYYASGTTYSMWYANRVYGHVYNGILYRISNDRKSIVKIDLSNAAASSSIRIIDSAVDDYIYDLRYWMLHSGIVWFMVYHYTASSYNYLGGIMYPDGYYVVNDVSYCSNSNYYPEDNQNKWNNVRTCDDDLLMWRYYQSSPYTQVYRNWAPNYLGTINNLEESITKTSAQTMKIVYTLTDVDEESGD